MAEGGAGGFTRRSVVRGAVLSIAQVAGVGIAYFAMYAAFYRYLGPELLGVWALVSAAAIFVRMADLGGSAVVLRYCALHSAAGQRRGCFATVGLAVATTGATMSIVALVVYSPISIVLSRLGTDAGTIRSLLIPALLSCIFAAVVTILTSTLDALGWFRVRALVVLASTLALTVGSAFAAATGDLVPVVWTQLGVQAATIPLALIPIGRALAGWRSDPPVRGNMREIVTYGWAIQRLSLVRLAAEPLTKFLLAQVAPLGFIGHYEMATRLVLQLRTVVTAVAQLLMPVIARAAGAPPSQLAALCNESRRWISRLNVALHLPVLTAAAAISRIWLGQIELEFILILVILLLGWLVNTFSSVSYFVSLARGGADPAIRAGLVLLVVNLTLGGGLGGIIGPYGVVLGAAVALAAGAVALDRFVDRSVVGGHLRQDVRAASPITVLATTIGLGLTATAILRPELEIATVLAGLVTGFLLASIVALPVVKPLLRMLDLTRQFVRPTEATG